MALTKSVIAFSLLCLAAASVEDEFSFVQSSISEPDDQDEVFDFLEDSTNLSDTDALYRQQAEAILANATEDMDLEEEPTQESVDEDREWKQDQKPESALDMRLKRVMETGEQLSEEDLLNFNMDEEEEAAKKVAQEEDRPLSEDEEQELTRLFYTMDSEPEESEEEPEEEEEEEELEAEPKKDKEGLIARVKKHWRKKARTRKLHMSKRQIRNQRKRARNHMSLAVGSLRSGSLSSSDDSEVAKTAPGARQAVPTGARQAASSQRHSYGPRMERKLVNLIPDKD